MRKTSDQEEKRRQEWNYHGKTNKPIVEEDSEVVNVQKKRTTVYVKDMKDGRPRSLPKGEYKKKKKKRKDSLIRLLHWQ